MSFRMAYIAYPIDQAVAMESLFDFIEDVKKTLLARLVDLTFDPGDAFNLRPGSEIGIEIESVNSHAQRTADLTVAFLPKGVGTVGVPFEIYRAAESGQTLLVFTDTLSWSLAGVATYPNVKIVGLDDDGFSEAMAWLQARPQEGTAATREAADPMPVRLLSETSRLPTRGYDDDAGLDLYVDGDHTIPPDGFLDVPCGVAVELPEWGWGFLTGRSSTLRTKQLLVQTGIIDAGYRGPLFAGVQNLTNVPVEVKDGERLAQLIVLPNLTKDLQPVRSTRLGQHARGEAGFGSTGS